MEMTLRPPALTTCIDLQMNYKFFDGSEKLSGIKGFDQ